MHHAKYIKKKPFKQINSLDASARGERKWTFKFKRLKLKSTQRAAQTRINDDCRRFEPGPPTQIFFMSSTRAGYQSVRRSASFFCSSFRIHRRREMTAQSCVHNEGGHHQLAPIADRPASTFTQRDPVPSAIYERSLRKKEREKKKGEGESRSEYKNYEELRIIFSFTCAEPFRATCFVYPRLHIALSHEDKHSLISSPVSGSRSRCSLRRRERSLSR